MICQTCGDSIPDDSVYCSTCGRSVSTAVDLQTEEEPVEDTGFIKKSRANFSDKLIIIALFILLLIALGVLAGMGTTFLRKTPLFRL
ncbi:MAG: hypothetical protein PHQ81_07480 [Methanofollis sp.]|nr:hypothetical protein [Methanofollis sp.]